MATKRSFGKKLAYGAVLLVTAGLLAIAALTAGAGEHPFFGTAWALLPPLVSITLALISKEVYSSLFVGLITGSLLYTEFSPKGTLLHFVDDGLVGTLTDSGKVTILLFVVLLGVFVELINRSGGADAFGVWVGKHIKSRAGLQLMALLLGTLFFIDDGFSCFTTGSVMRPVCDRNRVSRAKLAYIIDSTAAPICIIAPVSSWAAAVTGYVEDGQGLSVFIRAIPYNFYAILSLVMIVALSLFRLDFGAMRRAEEAAQVAECADERPADTRGRAWDLVLPVAALVAGCIVGMLYTGNFFAGTDFLTAVSNCDAARGFVYGSSVALVLTMLYYLARRLISFRDMMKCVPGGLNLMAAPMIILVFAWMLKSTTSALGIGDFVNGVVSGSAAGFQLFLPALIFLIASLLSFATGTSWGTFGLLIPITLEVFPIGSPLGIVCLSACMAGAVFGDHCSPISDTTIMASAAAGCDHVLHVSTQLPYAVTVAAVSFVGYLLSGWIQSPLIVLPITVVVLLSTLWVLRRRTEA